MLTDRQKTIESPQTMPLKPYSIDNTKLTQYAINAIPPYTITKLLREEGIKSNRRDILKFDIEGVEPLIA